MLIRARSWLQCSQNRVELLDDDFELVAIATFSTFAWTFGSLWSFRSFAIALAEAAVAQDRFSAIWLKRHLTIHAAGSTRCTVHFCTLASKILFCIHNRCSLRHSSKKSKGCPVMPRDYEIMLPLRVQAPRASLDTSHSNHFVAGLVLLDPFRADRHE